MAAAQQLLGEMIVSMLKPRARKVKILATLGPSSSSPEMIRALMEAGADAFRINMSHGNQADKAKLVDAIRALEKILQRPTTILFDLQGPKLRVGSFKGGSAMPFFSSSSRSMRSMNKRSCSAATLSSLMVPVLRIWLEYANRGAS